MSQRDVLLFFAGAVAGVFLYHMIRLLLEDRRLRKVLEEDAREIFRKKD